VSEPARNAHGTVTERSCAAKTVCRFQMQHAHQGHCSWVQFKIPFLLRRVLFKKNASLTRSNITVERACRVPNCFTLSRFSFTAITALCCMNRRWRWRWGWRWQRRLSHVGHRARFNGAVLCNLLFGSAFIGAFIAISHMAGSAGCAHNTPPEPHCLEPRRCSNPNLGSLWPIATIVEGYLVY
jgi:hypothetical protein